MKLLILFAIKLLAWLSIFKHNKKAFTYQWKQGNKPKKLTGKQTTLTNLFKTSLPKENRLDDNAGPSNLNVSEVELEASSSTTNNDSECDIDSSQATDECVNESAKVDGCLYLV